MTQPELKPCPFCGSNDVKSGGDDKVIGSWCQTCGSQGPDGYQSSAEWNHRPTEQALVEALRELLALEPFYSDDRDLAANEAECNKWARMHTERAQKAYRCAFQLIKETYHQQKEQNL